MPRRRHRRRQPGMLKAYEASELPDFMFPKLQAQQRKCPSSGARLCGASDPAPQPSKTTLPAKAASVHTNNSRPPRALRRPLGPSDPRPRPRPQKITLALSPFPSAGLAPGPWGCCFVDLVWDLSLSRTSARFLQRAGTLVRTALTSKGKVLTSERLLSLELLFGLCSDGPPSQKDAKHCKTAQQLRCSHRPCWLHYVVAFPPALYSRSQKVGNSVASIPKSKV